MSSLPNVAQRSSAARNASATHSTRRPSGLGGASCSRTIAGRKSRGSAWMRSPRRSTKRRAAARADAPGPGEVMAGSLIDLPSAQPHHSILQSFERLEVNARHRTQTHSVHDRLATTEERAEQSPGESIARIQVKSDIGIPREMSRQAPRDLVPLRKIAQGRGVLPAFFFGAEGAVTNLLEVAQAVSLPVLRLIEPAVDARLNVLPQALLRRVGLVGLSALRRRGCGGGTRLCGLLTSRPARRILRGGVHRDGRWRRRGTRLIL